jgi:ATP-binding cassette, subfamily B, bacterial
MRLKTVRIFGCLGWPVGITPILIDSFHFKMLGNAAAHCGIFLGAQVGELAGLCRDALVYGSLVIAVTQGSLSIAQFTLMFGMTSGFITLLDQLLKDFQWFANC